jgi:prephenate dehydrogenase
MKRVTVIGLGLIGGSFAKALRSEGLFDEIIGVENNEDHANLALKLGLVERIENLETAVNLSELVIVATPVDVAPQIAWDVLNLCNTQTVIDVGSTKKSILTKLNEHPKRQNFVASHPMAGTEFSGPNAAISDLFKGKFAIICDKDNSDAKRVEEIHKLYKSIGSDVIYMEEKEHDMSAAYVSHISHISSFALALTVLNKEKNHRHITALASGGFRSTVRLAKSNKDTWGAIFTQNKEQILDVIDDYIENMILFKHAIKSNNTEVVKTLIKQANEVNKVI